MRAHLRRSSLLALLTLGCLRDAAAESVVAANPPLSLTASDGTGLELVSVAAQAVVQGPLAFTELHLAFANRERRVREGRFRITLPSGATLSRFAMKIDGRWQEGEVVELQAARVAYEDFLHRRQDPALLETEAGNEFSARVFPIPAGATKELIVSYTQELAGRGEPYRLPLRGLPRLGNLDIRVLVSRDTHAGGAGAPSNLGGTRARHEVVEVQRRDFQPDRDFEVPTSSTAAGLRHGSLLVMRVRPVADTLPLDPIRALTVLVDTSASRALGFEEQISRTIALVTALRRANPAADPTVQVLAFDQEVHPIYDGPMSGIGAARARLRDRRALGASDLGRALTAVTKSLAAPRLLLVTDGVATAGETEGAALRKRVAALATVGVERLDVLAVGGIRDDERLAALTAAGLPRAGVVLDGRLTVEEAARRLTLGTRSGIAVQMEGATWVWPQRFDGAQPGDERLVYAELPSPLPVRLRIGGVAAPIGQLALVERPLLERAWVKARMGRLMHQRETVAASDVDLAEALRKQVTELSVRHRVLSPFTALLVLETEGDYRRFGIERRALTDIISVGPGGVTVLERKDVVVTDRTEPGRQKGGLSGLRGGGASRRFEKAEEMSEGRRAESSSRASDDDASGASDLLLAEESAGRTAPSREGLPRARREAFDGRGVAGAVASAPAESMRGRRSAAALPAAAPEAPGFMPAPEPPLPLMKRTVSAPHEGTFAEIMRLLARGDREQARRQADAWRARDAGDVLALVALGEVAEARQESLLAARAYGSLIDLFPGRADLRRFAAARLERLRHAPALALAVDSYQRAVEQRPDHPGSHRGLAFALAKAGRLADAFAAVEAGLNRAYPGGRFAGVERVLREDLGLLAAAWRRVEPSRAGEIQARAQKLGAPIATGPSLRFVLTWETDANDVDFHILDARGGHASFERPQLPSGGELFADVTTGYGPECFAIATPAERRAYPYRVRAHYYRRGPMGYGMGRLQIVDHDGQGQLRFDERPFVVMADGAMIDLGVVKAPSPRSPVAQTAR